MEGNVRGNELFTKAPVSSVDKREELLKLGAVYIGRHIDGISVRFSLDRTSQDSSPDIEMHQTSSLEADIPGIPKFYGSESGIRRVQASSEVSQSVCDWMCFVHNRIKAFASAVILRG
jgi:hypothetical protein